jgi:hypothetical protein
VVLETVRDLGLGERDALVEERLADDVVGGVGAMLGGDGRRVDGGDAGVCVVDDLLLDEAHGAPAVSSPVV